MQKDVELLIMRKRALMNENFSKSNTYNAGGIKLSDEINSLVELVNNNIKLAKENQALVKENEKLKGKKK